MQNLAYPNKIRWEIFAGIGSIGVALMTTGIQRLNAALANPVIPYGPSKAKFFWMIKLLFESLPLS